MCLGGYITCVTKAVQKFSNANFVCVCIHMYACMDVCVLIFLF